MNQEFIFCPRCGAVTKPGICTNCGYDIEAHYEEVNSSEDSFSENEVSDENEVISDSSSEVNKEDYETVNTVSDSSERKNRWWIWALVIFGVFALILLVIAVIVVIWLGYVGVKAYSVYTTSNQQNQMLLHQNAHQASLVGEDEEDEDEPEESVYYDSLVGNDSSGYDYDYDAFDDYISKANDYSDSIVEEDGDFFSSPSYYSNNGESHEFKERDSFERPYYDYLVNSYVENENYSVERHQIRYEGKQNDVYINDYSAYYQIVSDTVDFTVVNEELKRRATYDLYNYLDSGSVDSDSYNYLIYCDSFITFNNDEIMSIVYNVTSYDENYTDMLYEYGVNIDMKTGEIMDNDRIINTDETFAEFFKDRSFNQNGYVAALEDSEAKEISATLSDDKSRILFFTPLGLEIGINYRYGYSYGWVTVSINDFASYMFDDYDFETDFGSSLYDIYEYEKNIGIYQDDLDVIEDEFDFDPSTGFTM